MRLFICLFMCECLCAWDYMWCECLFVMNLCKNLKVYDDLGPLKWAQNFVLIPMIFGGRHISCSAVSCFLLYAGALHRIVVTVCRLSHSPNTTHPTPIQTVWFGKTSSEVADIIGACVIWGPGVDAWNIFGWLTFQWHERGVRSGPRSVHLSIATAMKLYTRALVSKLRYFQHAAGYLLVFTPRDLAYFERTRPCSAHMWFAQWLNPSAAKFSRCHLFFAFKF